MNELHGSYVWGLDGSPGTFISDYVVFGLCLVYGICVIHLYKSSKWNGRRLQKKSEVKAAIRLYALGKDFEKAKTFLLVFSATFLFCALMNAVGALLHHFVPLLEPISLQSDISSSHDSAKGNLWQLMLLKLFPWVLVWQFASISAVLYGIGIFVTALYTMDFHMSSKYYAFQKSYIIKHGTAYSRFHYVKRIFLAGAFMTVVFHSVSRFHRIFEFRSVILDYSTADGSVVDLHSAKLDIEKFGWIWQTRSATTIMFSAFLINALISLYMCVKAITAHVSGSTDFGGVKIALVRTLGGWMLLVGGIIQVMWAGSCASNIPNECPFPIWFNHNAWYHLLQGLGMTLWFLAEWAYFNGNSVTLKKA